MASNRLKESMDSSKKNAKSKLTTAGKIEDVAIDNADDTKNLDVKTEQNNKIDDDVIDNPKPNRIEIAVDSNIKEDQLNENRFVIEKRGEPDLKKPKIYNLKLGNIRKVKELADQIGISESALVDFLIENGTDILKIR